MSENNNQNNNDKATESSQTRKLGTIHNDNGTPSITRSNEYSATTSTTRAGTTKMKFAPKIQPRRKPVEVKPEPSSSTSATADSNRGRGRGRGRGEASRGRGRGRGEMIMTASGPFAMGPSKNAGMSRSKPQASNITIGGNRQALDNEKSQLTGDTKPKIAGARGATVKADPELYSDEEDEGMEIIDIQQVDNLDENAPLAIPKEHYKYESKRDKKSNKAKPTVKSENDDGNDMKIDEKHNENEENDDEDDVPQVDVGALDLSESEEEDENEDVASDFNQAMEEEEDKLLFFQFPQLFPKYTNENKNDKKVSFADDKNEDDDVKVKSDPESKPDKSKIDEQDKHTGKDDDNDEGDDEEGEIGEILVYADGKVKMHVGNGIVFDINRATQPSFLQNVVNIDDKYRQISVLGEVGHRYVVTPDIDRLLDQSVEDDATANMKS